ncbi:MAG: hypothetical protein KDI63_13750 [Gammaproteobacteria bacterium]|nr:hypothetical protein [Gammaproteobacteria bacterium]
MNTQNNPSAKLLIFYLMLALAPTWLHEGSLAVLIAVFLYGACALFLEAASRDSTSRKAKGTEHPVQAGKAPLIGSSHRLITGNA